MANYHMAALRAAQGDADRCLEALRLAAKADKDRVRAWVEGDRFFDAVRELRTGGLTFVMATHEMAFARDVADRVCFLREGAIWEQGSPEEIFTDPRREETRQFLARVLHR